MRKTVHITHGKYIHVFAIIGAANTALPLYPKY